MDENTVASMIPIYGCTTFAMIFALAFHQHNVSAMVLAILAGTVGWAGSQAALLGLLVNTGYLHISHLLGMMTILLSAGSLAASLLS